MARRRIYLAAQLVAGQSAQYYVETKEGARKLKRFIRAASGYVWYVRILPWFPTGKLSDYKRDSGKYASFPWEPVKVDGRWTWDLDRYNERYFSSLDTLIYVLNRAGFSIVFDLIDYCELFVPEYRRKSPLWNNKQGLKFGNPELIEYIQDFTDRIVKILEYHEPYGFMIEIGNEIYGGGAGADFVKEMADYLIQKGFPVNRILVPTGVEGGDYCHNIAKAGRQRKNGTIPQVYRGLVPAVHLGTFQGSKATKIVNSGAWDWLMKSFYSVWLSTDGIGEVHNLDRDITMQVTALNKMIEELKKYQKTKAFLEIQGGYYWWADIDEFGYERPHYRLKFLPSGYFREIVSRLDADVERRLGDVDGAIITLERLVQLHKPKKWWFFFRDIFRRLLK